MAPPLDALRTPLEEGEVRLSRAEGTVHYPARFQLVLAANPCPCAPAHDRDCICPSMARRRYLGRMSGPLLDRVDLRARMFPVTLTAGTVVVEAGLRSGAQRTASDATGLGRLVMAVPGPVTSGMSAGSHQLVRDGALLVTRTEEVLEAVGRIGVDLADRHPSGPRRPTDDLDPVAVLVHDALPARAAREARWLAMEAGVPIGAVRAALVTLERRALVEHRDGRWRRSAAGADTPGET